MDDRKDRAELDAETMDRLLQDAMDGVLSTELAPWADAAVSQMMARTKMLMGTVVDYKELMMRYACAIKEVRTKFDVLNTEFKTRYQRNPISSISTRLKRTASITQNNCFNFFFISLSPS